MTDGKLPDKTGVTSSGQDLVVPLLNRCLKFTDMVEERYSSPYLYITPFLLTTSAVKERSTNGSKTFTTNFSRSGTSLSV
jgi:hypothetical protein